MVLYSKLCIDFCHYFKLVLFFPQQRGKKKKSKTKILLSGNSELHPTPSKLLHAVYQNRFREYFIRSDTSADLAHPPYKIKLCWGWGNKKIQGFLYDFEKASCGCWPSLTGRWCLVFLPCFVFCYSNLNYSSWCQLFSFLKKKGFCVTVTGELFILCISIFLLHFWLFCLAWIRFREPS